MVHKKFQYELPSTRTALATAGLVARLLNRCRLHVVAPLWMGRLLGLAKKWGRRPDSQRCSDPHPTESFKITGQGQGSGPFFTTDPVSQNPRRTSHSTNAVKSKPTLTATNPMSRFTRHKPNRISPTSRFAHSCALRAPQRDKKPKPTNFVALCAPQTRQKRKQKC